MADLQPPEAPTSGIAALSEPLLPCTVSKRQRRPSVRLGDIGDQPTAIVHEYRYRRPKKWNASSSFSSEVALQASAGAGVGAGTGQPFKARSLTNLRSDEPHELSTSPADDRRNLETRAVGICRVSRKGKGRRGDWGVAAAEARLVRPYGSSKAENGAESFDLRSSSGVDTGDEAYGEYDELRRECSESPTNTRPSARVKFPESLDAVVAAADVMQRVAPSEMDGGDWHNQNGRCQFVEDGGVRSWLDQIGLVRYAPVFDLHEVDEEVLPLLTLEDLVDMGISTVGSRRKMYSAIQKLSKSLS